MQPTIQIDTRPLQLVLREYARHNKRDWADIVNDKLLDVAFRAVRETPKADLRQIRALPQRPWWPKYVAKRIMSQSGVSFTRRRGGLKEKFNIKGHYTRNEARKASAGIIASRIRAVTFLRSGWLWAIQKLWTVVRRSKRGLRSGATVAKQYGKAKGGANPAMPGDFPVGEIFNSTEGIEKHGVGPLERAVFGSIEDMRIYIARKMEERARRVAR